MLQGPCNPLVIHMNIEEAYELVFDKRHTEMTQLISSGLNPNQTDGVRVSLSEFAYFEEDFKMMKILWKAGAEAKSPAVEEVFQLFNNGINYNQVKGLLDSKENEEIHHFVEYESDKFSIQNLKIEYLQINDDLTELELKFENFKIGTDIVNERLTFDLNPISEKLKNQSEIQLGKDQITDSIYLFNVYNPIDITQIKLSNKNVMVDFLFDFEHENTGYRNEKLTVSTNN